MLSYQNKVSSILNSTEIDGKHVSFNDYFYANFYEEINKKVDELVDLIAGVKYNSLTIYYDVLFTNIVNEYISNSVNIYHFDVYRLSDTDEFYAIGGEEYFEKGICLIEWGELIEDALPFEYIHISFEKTAVEPDSRLLKITALGEKYELILDKIKEELNWKF